MKYKYFLLLLIILFVLFSCDIPSNKNGNNSGNSISVDAGDNKIARVNEYVIFNGTGYEEGGFIKSYSWDFDGDGIFDETSSNAVTCKHRYSSAGIYEVRFRVTDEHGNSAEDTCVVKVGYPKPLETEGTWNTFEDPPIPEVFFNSFPSSTFYYGESFYMIYYDYLSNLNYLKSKDGISWLAVTEDSFPVSIPEEAKNSNDLAIYYNIFEDMFIITFSKSGKVFVSRSDNGQNWNNDDFEEENAVMEKDGFSFSKPSYVKTFTQEIVWAIGQDGEIYYKTIGSTTQPVKIDKEKTLGLYGNSIIKICRVLFDGKTYFMWYSWEQGSMVKLNLITSQNCTFESGTIQQNIIPLTITGFYRDGIYINTILFDYDSYEYLLFFKGKNNTFKIGLSKCNSFYEMPGYGN